MSKSLGRAEWIDPLSLIRWSIRVVILVGLLIYFIIEGRSFLSVGNFYSLMQGFALLGLIALGLSLTMIAGEFDLSIGAIAATSGMVALQFGQDSILAGVLAGVAFGLLVGVVNGILIAFLDMPSMVVTIGTLIAVAGTGSLITHGRGETLENFELSTTVSQAVLEIFSPRSIITIAIIALAGALMYFTMVGRNVRAIGSDSRAAQASGVSRRKVIIGVFAFSGICGALAGSLLAYDLAVALPDFTGGGTLLLQGATAAIIGGVGLAGGVGSIRGVVFGVITLSVLTNGLGSTGAAASTVSLVTGGLLLFLVLLDGQEQRIRRWSVAWRAQRELARHGGAEQHGS